MKLTWDLEYFALKNFFMSSNFYAFILTLYNKSLAPVFKCFIFFSLFILSCTNTPLPPIDLKVEYDGCKTVKNGPVCIPKQDNTIILWVKTEKNAEIDIYLSGKKSISKPKAIQGGWQYKIKNVSNYSKISVTSTLNKRKSEWNLIIGNFTENELIKKANQLRKQSETDKAITLLKSEFSNSSKELLGELNSLVARLYMEKADYTNAIIHFNKAINIYNNRRQWFKRFKDSTALAFIYIYRTKEFSKASDVLKLKNEEYKDYGTSSFYLDYFKGLLDFETGDMRSAINRLKDSIKQAKRLDLIDLEIAGKQMLSEPLVMLGRYKEADKVFDELWESAGNNLSSCQKAQLLNNRGWVRILAKEADEALKDSALNLFEEAESIVKSDCNYKNKLVNIKINTALALIQENNIKKAEEIILYLEKNYKDKETRFLFWLLDIKGKIAFLAKDYQKALTIYNRLEHLAALHLNSYIQWRAKAGIASIFEMQKEFNKALLTYKNMEKIVDSNMFKIPIGEGRATFIAQRKKGTISYINLLLKLNKTEEALNAVRYFRIRTILMIYRNSQINTLSENKRKQWDQIISKYKNIKDKIGNEISEEWTFPADQLVIMRQNRKEKYLILDNLLDNAYSVFSDSQNTFLKSMMKLKHPEKGELLLTYYPLNKDTWISFAYDSLGIMSRKFNFNIKNITKDSFSKLLINPFKDKIEKNSLIKILAYGELDRVDFHSIPYKKGKLIEYKNIVYSLDLNPDSSKQIITTNKQVITTKTGDFNEKSIKQLKTNMFLLVTDPRNNLTYSELEGKEIKRNVENKQNEFKILQLHGSAASSKAVYNNLLKSNLFHYSGHGLFKGFGGWQSSLWLAHNTELRVKDIFTLQRSPYLSVLLGCETAKTDLSQSNHIGLAQAFAIAGSRFVIASSRPVKDNIAVEFAKVFYSEKNLMNNIVKAYKNAIIFLYKKFPTDDWGSLRLITP